jgi:primosomal protein N' (replication factor Y)
MIHIQLRHPRPQTVEEAAKLMGSWLSYALGDMVTPPFQPGVARLRTYYLQEMVIRMPAKPAEIARVKNIVNRAVRKLGTTDKLTGVRVAVDVDPY